MKTESELENIESLMKIAGCIKMELIPATGQDLDKKKFEWTLTKFDQENLEIKLTFENPKYISIDGSDSVKITFDKTNYFL